MRATILLLSVFLVLATGAQAQEVGRIASITGDARIEGPEGSRALAPGDALNAGDRLVLGDGARLGVLSGALFAQIQGVPGGSRLVVGRTAEGLPDFTLESGRMRLVDTRDPSEPGRSRIGNIPE